MWVQVHLASTPTAGRVCTNKVTYPVVNVRSPPVILAVLIALCAVLGVCVWLLWPAAALDTAPAKAPSPVAPATAAPAPPAPAPAARRPTTGGVVLAVVDLERRPVPDALVELLGSGRIEPVRTGSDGTAEFARVPAGPWKLRVQASRFSMLTEGPISVVAGETAEFEATLEPLRALLGQVSNPDGVGVDGAQVEFWPEGAPGVITTAQTRNGGQFLVTGLEAGPYLLRATHPHFAASVAQRAIAGAPEKIHVELGASGEILGKVLTPAGQVLQSFYVTIERFVPEVGIDGLEARHYRPRKGGHGLFLLTNLAPGRYDLRVDPPGFGPGAVADVRVFSGQRTEGVTIELSGGASLRGSVHDQASGEPIAGAEVRVSDAAVWGRNLPREAVRTDTDGEFLLEGLTPGRRGVRVRARGYVTSIVTVDGLQEGRETSMDVELEPQAAEGPPKVKFFGIGAVLKTEPDGSVAVREVVEGGPGAEFGLRAGDTILQVDGREASGLGLGRVVEAIRGEEDTTVLLLVRRRGESVPFEVSIERGQVKFDASPH